MVADDPEPKRLLTEADVLRAVVDCVPDPVTVIGVRGETLLQNALSRAALPDPPPASLADWDQGFTVHSADGASVIALEDWPLARALRGEAVVDFETSVIMPNDPTRPTLLNARAIPIHDASGNVTGAVLISQDITAQRRIERELAQSQRMEAIGQLATGVAHDFNNILTAIGVLADTLSQGQGATDRDRQIADRIAAATTQGRDLVKRLLAFARQQPLSPGRVEVNPLVEELVSLLRVTLGGHIEVSADLHDGVLPALVDPSQLSNALLNLAVNARDAMPNGGALKFRTDREDDRVVIEVADTGAGIPFDQQAKVFEPFFTTKAPGHGAGLGLAMVYGFVAQSGGTIELRSAPGHGTAVLMRLPLAA